MKPLYVRVVLFDPVSDEGFPVSDGIQVDVVKINDFNPLVGFNRRSLKYNSDNDLFTVKAPRYHVSQSHYLRVGFKKVNFSKITGQLMATGDVENSHLPVYCPARLPYWDSGWDDDYETNEFFDDDDLISDPTPDSPLVLRIPLRRVYIIGHRGAPQYFPENTMASFQKALELGANGLEFDICLTKDKKLVVFHDPEPVKHPDRMDRTLFESFPYELVSPEFNFSGKTAFIKKFINGNYKTSQKIRMKSDNQLDIVKLTVNQIKKIYRYHHVEEVEHDIPELSEFLDFAHQERERLQLLFFDVKNPNWDETTEAALFVNYGKRIATEIQKNPVLPARLIICNASEDVLKHLKRGFKAAGENRCEFAFDAQGSFGALFGFKKDPLKVARKLNNAVISIGSLFRPGNLGEMTEATRDRDYNSKSKLSTIIHWTLNEPSQMYSSFSAGVNGIVTDKPEVFKKLLRKLKVYTG